MLGVTNTNFLHRCLLHFPLKTNQIMGRYFLWHIHDKIGVNFLLDDHFADDTSFHCSTNRGFLITAKNHVGGQSDHPTVGESLGPLKHPKNTSEMMHGNCRKKQINLRVPYFFGHNHLAKPVDMVNVP